MSVLKCACFHWIVRVVWRTVRSCVLRLSVQVCVRVYVGARVVDASVHALRVCEDINRRKVGMRSVAPVRALYRCLCCVCVLKHACTV